MPELGQFLIACIVIAGGLYILQRIQIDDTIKMIVKVVLIIVLVIWAIRLFWPMAGLG